MDVVERLQSVRHKKSRDTEGGSTDFLEVPLFPEAPLPPNLPVLWDGGFDRSWFS